MNESYIMAFEDFCDRLYIDDNIAEEGFITNLKNKGARLGLYVRKAFINIKEVLRSLIITLNTRSTVEVPNTIATVANKLFNSASNIGNNLMQEIVWNLLSVDPTVDPDNILNDFKNSESYKILHDDSSKYASESKVKVNMNTYRAQLLHANKDISNLEKMAAGYKFTNKFIKNEIKGNNGPSEFQNIASEMNAGAMNKCKGYIAFLKIQLYVVKTLLKWSKV